jgi:Spy/CpxP family protein refolding chaperone
MTPRRTLTLLFATLFLGAGLLATPAAAQSGPDRRPPPRRALPDGARAGKAERKPERGQRARLLKRLDLTEEQRARAREIFRQHRPAMHAARAARRQDLAGTLTPQQRARLEAMKQTLQRTSRDRAGPRRAEARSQRRRV